jgi:hypothetical protein
MSLLANPLRRVTGYPGLFVRKLTAAERATLGGKADLSPEQFRDALAGIVACDGAEQPVTNLTPDQVAAVYLAAVAHNNLVGPAVRERTERLAYRKRRRRERRDRVRWQGEF